MEPNCNCFSEAISRLLENESWIQTMTDDDERYIVVGKTEGIMDGHRFFLPYVIQIMYCPICGKAYKQEED